MKWYGVELLPSPLPNFHRVLEVDAACVVQCRRLDGPVDEL